MQFERGTGMQRSRLSIAAVVTLVAFTLASIVPVAKAQQRLSDKDVETLLNNLKSDTKKFRSSFNSGVGKSTIRKTSQEKDAKNLVQEFEKQTEATLNKFKQDQRAETELSALLNTGGQIDKLLNATPMGDQANADWSKVRTELDGVAKQFNLEFPPK